MPPLLNTSSASGSALRSGLVLIVGQVVAEPRVDLEQADAAALQAELADPLGDDLAEASVPALADVAERRGRFAAHRLDVRAAHGIHERRLSLERHDDVHGDRVPLPVAGEPERAAAEAPVVRPAGHDRAVELALTQLRAQRRRYSACENCG